jgi:hypothetical protein
MAGGGLPAVGDLLPQQRLPRLDLTEHLLLNRFRSTTSFAMIGNEVDALPP